MWQGAETVKIHMLVNGMLLRLLTLPKRHGLREERFVGLWWGDLGEIMEIYTGM